MEFCDVRFGSKADICAAKSDVGFTPDSNRKSGFSERVMSALPPKADICSAQRHVRYGPKADISAKRRVALWVRSRHFAMRQRCPLYPQERIIWRVGQIGVRRLTRRKIARSANFRLVSTVGFTRTAALALSAHQAQARWDSAAYLGE